MSIGVRIGMYAPKGTRKKSSAHLKPRSLKRAKTRSIRISSLP